MPKGVPPIRFAAGSPWRGRGDTNSRSWTPPERRAGREGTPCRPLAHVFENLGFYFILNHGVARSLIEAAFGAAERFHDLPLERKLELRLNQYNIGYLPMRGGVTRHSALNENNKPNVNAAFFMGRDLPPDHPDVRAGKPHRCRNQWPRDLPGFREDCLAYAAALEQLGRLVPLY
ncbi:MAG: 2-oxoglutarate and iron-dependent oxygenase domain-containing protein, partial [Hyphomicrobiaceae bacterium]|nr:2-oxoglutarate and iron-dependent oxygenase domain-containing protein [Hyphomicrobiaceae bacterium]